MKELANIALNITQMEGASYTDIRIILARSESIALKNGVIGHINKGESLGFGVRVIINGGWGFSSSSRLNKEGIEEATRLACRTARTTSSLKLRDIHLTPEPIYNEIWQTPYAIDPFKVSLEEKLTFLAQIDKILRADTRIKVAISSMDFFNEHQWLATSEGTFIDQSLMRSAAGFSAMAVDKGEMQIRSYPSSHGGLSMSMGYELVRESDFLENAERIRDEAIALLTAPKCPQGEKDIILDGAQLALQIHESCGHPTELDRVLGSEADYAGTSFLLLDQLHKLQYGSEIVDLIIDGTVPGGLATVGFDDDGVRAGRYYIVKEGRFVGYQTNRELGRITGENFSRGCNRADGFSAPPMIRQSNLSLMPGEWTLEELIEDTQDGIYMINNKSWSIDQRRLNFQFGCEIAWEIKKGKIGRIFKDPTYQGMTIQFWNSCDAICNQDNWRLWGVLNCGKGQPNQRAEMSHGAASARFRKVRVGIGS
ncbi:TPA: peptidase C69 [bacterium]|nr:peptidase C69 [bacterium]